MLDIVGRGYNNDDYLMNDYLGNSNANQNSNLNNNNNQRRTYDLYSSEYVPTVADVFLKF